MSGVACVYEQLATRPMLRAMHPCCSHVHISPGVSEMGSRCVLAQAELLCAALSQQIIKILFLARRLASRRRPVPRAAWRGTGAIGPRPLPALANAIFGTLCHRGRDCKHVPLLSQNLLGTVTSGSAPLLKRVAVLYMAQTIAQLLAK